MQPTGSSHATPRRGSYPRARGTPGRPAALLLLAALLLAPAPLSAGEDLTRRYPATLQHSEFGLDWTSGADDVWRLRSFEIRQGSKFQLSCRAASVVFGVHETNVLWAVVFPDEPARLRTELAGDGEETRAVLLRFAPSDLGRYFPKKIVAEPGPAVLTVRAGALFRHKIGWRWSTPSGNPTVVPSGICIVDADTDAGKRRFYALGTGGGVEYVAEFEDRPAPPEPALDARTALEIFDEVWSTFDQEYAMFVLLPELNWDRLRKEYRTQAARAETRLDLAGVLAEMLSHLQDLHVWVKAGEVFLPGYRRERPGNANLTATRAELVESHEAGEDLLWGRTRDDIGYLNILGLGDPDLPGQVDAALEALADTWGLIVDLRFNGGGDEVLAQQIAGRFLDEPRVYATHRFRNGPKRDQLGGLSERICHPRGPWRYEAPVVGLLGRRALSSAEALAGMLKVLPQATTMGDFTGGSTGNPRRLTFDCGITVNMPRWIAYTPQGQPIERHGVEPDQLLPTEASDFSDKKDPIMEAALKHLRKLSPKARRPGRAEGS